MKQLLIIIQILLASVSLSGQTQENHFVSLSGNQVGHSIVLNEVSLRSMFPNMLSEQCKLEPNAERWTIIEIETKAGMEFFESFGSSSNFMIQSGNSLMTVSRIEDYKVFLNPGLVADKQTAINKVVDVWSKQGWFGKTEIINKFASYLKRPIRTSPDLETVLRTNTSWFDEIFLKNIDIK